MTGPGAEPVPPTLKRSADPMVPAVARLSGRRRETADTWTLAIERHTPPPPTVASTTDPDALLARALESYGDNRLVMESCRD